MLKKSSRMVRYPTDSIVKRNFFSTTHLNCITEQPPLENGPIIICIQWRLSSCIKYLYINILRKAGH